MKKIFCMLCALAVLSTGLFAAEKENLKENFRVSLNVSDSISSNIISLVNTTSVGVEVSTYNDNIGLIGGVMFREMTLLSDDAFRKWTINWNPFVGIELWNTEILVGFIPQRGDSGDMDFAPYAAVNYNFDLIPPTNGFSNSLSLKVGMEYFIDLYDSDDSEEAIGNAFVAVFSMLLPKVSIGVQYKLGNGWAF